MLSSIIIKGPECFYSCMLEDAISKLESDRKEETMEMLTSWEKKGRIEGRLEGKQEGRLEGKQEGRLEGKEEGIQLLVKSMSSYFKMEIPDLIAREISDLPDMKLSKLAGEWPSMHSVSELEAWITMNRAEAKSGTN